jgi:hypothetical protein
MEPRPPGAVKARCFRETLTGPRQLWRRAKPGNQILSNPVLSSIEPNTNSTTIARWTLVAGLERHLVRTSSPRVKMAGLVLATGSIGLLTSFSLLHLHLENMMFRYLISVVVAYGAFLGLIWLWLFNQQTRWSRIAKAPFQRTACPKAPEDHFFLKVLEILLELDETMVYILFAAAFVSVFVVIGYLCSAIVYAPQLTAEIFLDGVFSAALYRRLSRIERRDWLRSAVVRTRAPFLWTLLFFGFLAFVSHHYVPDAVSIGGVIRRLY